MPAPFAELPANLSRVCVVRVETFDDRTAFPTWDNGVLVGATRGGTHFCYIAEPGVHEIVMGAKNTISLAATLEAGKGYYLEHEAIPAAGVTNVKATWIADATAKLLLGQSSYEVITEVPKSPCRTLPR